MKAVFDTNILIDYLNGFSQARAELKLYSDKRISIISWMEIWVGSDEQTTTMTRTFLNSFKVEPLSAEIAELGVGLRKSRGLKLPDAIIYATAKQQGCSLVTRNTKDFDPQLPDIRCPYTL